MNYYLFGKVLYHDGHNFKSVMLLITSVENIYFCLFRDALMEKRLMMEPMAENMTMLMKVFLTFFR